jgi:5-(carboxyamino)imidazole ribonucleotide synthase
MILPGSVIGIIGGGQLGRMMACAAAELGYKTHIFTPEQDAPASHVAYKTTVADYADIAALAEFANEVDVITFEFENVPHESLVVLEQLKPVRPSAHVLKICRNRAREKQAVNALGIATAPFRVIGSQDDLVKALEALKLPAVLKTSEMGYDGKGQVTIKKPQEAEAAWRQIDTTEAVLESFIGFQMEISVIVARGVGGEIQTYIPVQNIHQHHILDITIAPAPINSGLIKAAEATAVRIATTLGVCGLLAVEMFVTKDERILVNELAPRPHNSGHWTMDACVTSQFEQMIRAVCGLPLGSTERFCNAEMKNLIGDAVRDWSEYLKHPNIKLHLYGKTEIRPGRKMGHVTLLKSGE